MYKLSKKLKRTMLSLALVSLMSGCVKKVISVTNSGCTTFDMIYPSVNDTDGTKHQVNDYNDIYQAICGGEDNQKEMNK